MPEQALYLKYRPLTFEDVVGQEHVNRTLRNSLKTGRIRHAYLFSGPRGTGKTTSARLLAKAVNCQNEDPGVRPCNECDHCLAVNEGRYLDLIEIDAASHTGVDDVRELRDRIAFSPAEGKYKVYIIDEVHRFSGNAFDALLKTLEEPPDHAIFILATTEIDKVPATIKSRCLPFEFRRFTMKEVVDRLSLIVENEGLKVEREALELIAREGTGIMRDSISLLDQIVADPDEVITLELTQRILGTASARAVRDLMVALIEQDVARGLHIINGAIDSGSDPKQFGKQVVEHLRSIMLAQTASADLLEASADDRQMFAQQAASIDRSALLRAIRAFNDAVNGDVGGWQPQLSLELAYIESLQAPVEPMVPMSAPVAQQQRPASAQPAQESGPAYVPPEPTQPGAPPVIPASEVRSNWVKAQRLIFQHAPQAGEQVANLPNLMEHVQVQSVEGNFVVLAASNRFYLEKLRDQTRTNWIQRALSRVNGIELLVRYVLADDANREPSPSPDLDDDPLVDFAVNELGGTIQEDE
ncbi:MAG: DNA polymerase III subunit gamma/tau [Anaerolineaceae bacterium]|nr:DNA polymerase III subunit gamma/tau [Anaerolineaceae bacterium]